ncbi:MAG: FimB/Mfa2 family fimbrial subunit, partial [Phocaeicola vulgatus]
YVLLRLIRFCFFLPAAHEMTNQEYLDRQDEYNMTFFLDESMKWINTSIIINDWVVRFNELDM